MADVEGKKLHASYHPALSGESTTPQAVMENGINEIDEVAMERVEKVYK